MKTSTIIPINLSTPPRNSEKKEVVAVIVAWKVQLVDVPKAIKVFRVVVLEQNATGIDSYALAFDMKTP